MPLKCGMPHLRDYCAAHKRVPIVIDQARGINQRCGDRLSRLASTGMKPAVRLSAECPITGGVDERVCNALRHRYQK